MVGSVFLNPVHEALHKAYVAAGKAETMQDGSDGGSNEEIFASAVKGATIEEICEATGLTPDQVRTMMAQIKEHVLHRSDISGVAAHNDAIRYGLKKHFEGQPGWKPL